MLTRSKRKQKGKKNETENDDEEKKWREGKRDAK